MVIKYLVRNLSSQHLFSLPFLGSLLIVVGGDGFVSEKAEPCSVGGGFLTGVVRNKVKLPFPLASLFRSSFKRKEICFISDRFSVSASSYVCQQAFYCHRRYEHSS